MNLENVTYRMFNLVQPPLNLRNPSFSGRNYPVRQDGVLHKGTHGGAVDVVPVLRSGYSAMGPIGYNRSYTQTSKTFIVRLNPKA